MALSFPRFRDVDVCTFVRSIALPTTIDQENIQAELKDGVLRLRLPKASQGRSRQIQIRAGGQGHSLPGEPSSAAEPELAGAGAGPSGKRR